MIGYDKILRFCDCALVAIGMMLLMLSLHSNALQCAVAGLGAALLCGVSRDYKHMSSGRFVADIIGSLFGMCVGLLFCA